MESAEQDPRELKGTLHAISPEEIRAALLERINERIDAGADTDELLEWRSVLLTVSYHYKVLSSEDAVKGAAMDYREHLIVDFNSMARTARQWVCTIATLKADVEKKHGKKTDAEIAEWINTNVGIAPNTEAITENFVKSALDIHDKMFMSNPEHAKLVEDAEDEWGHNSPLNQISKMHLITKGCKTAEQLAWVLQCIVDSVRAGVYSAGMLNFNALKGDGNNKGFIDIFCKRLEMKTYLLSIWQDKRAFDPLVKAKLREVFMNHTSFREHVAFLERDQQDLSWQTSWSPSAMQTARFLEDAIYNKEFDATYKYALRSKRTLSEIIEMERFQEVIGQIDESFEAEKAHAGASSEEAGGDAVDEAEEEDEDVKMATGSLEGLVDDPATISVSNQEELERYQKEAAHVVQTLKLVETPSSVTAMAKEVRSMIDAQPATQGKDAPDKITLVMYNAVLSGESITNPRTRKPPLRQHYHMLMEGVLRALAPKGLPDNLVFLIFNGSKEGECKP